MRGLSLQLNRATKRDRYQRITTVARSICDTNGIVSVPSLVNHFDLRESREMIERYGKILCRAKKILIAYDKRGQVWIDLTIKA
jgi:hypothetical protein